MKNLKVALFNDQILLSEGIKQLLMNELEIKTIIEFSSASELINLSVDLVIVYDYATQFRSLPTDFKLSNRTTPLLFLTNSEQEVNALKVQNLPSLYLISSNCAKEDFFSLITEIIKPQNTTTIRRKSPKGQKITVQVDRLSSTFSPREREVIKLAMSGLQSKQIGRILEISPRTVDKHRANSMQKCNAKNIVELISHIQTKNIEL